MGGNRTFCILQMAVYFISSFVHLQPMNEIAVILLNVALQNASFISDKIL